MPPVDPETLFLGRTEPNIFITSGDPVMIEDPDLPPESVRLPIGDDLRWTKLNKVLDRGPSTIGNANPKSTRSSSKPKSHLQRLNPREPISILGLPNSAFHANGSRPSPASRIFPLNFAVERKPAAVSDPGSPKVSCFGTVLSDKERKIRQRSSVEWAGCWGNFLVLLGFAGVYPAVSGNLEAEVGRRTDFSGESERETADSAAPELQGMRRFASGRRQGSWAGDVDPADNVHVASLEPLDREGALRRC